MAPRRTRGPRSLPTWGGRRRKGAPRCSSGGSPSRAAAVAGAAAAAVSPSSWRPHREPSSQLPVGHASSAVVAKVAVGHSSASSSSGYFSPRDEVSTSSLQPPCMSSPSGCSPQQPGLATCVADADGADAVVGASSGNPSAALPTSLPEEEEPLSPALQMEVALPDEEEPLSPTLQMEVALPEEEPLLPALQMEVALQRVVAKFLLFHFDAHEKRMLSTDELKSLSPRLEGEIGEVNADGADAVEEVEEEEPLSPALQKYADGVDDVDNEEEEEEPLSPAFKMEVAIEVLFRLDLARKKRVLSADELDLIIHLKSQLPCLEAEIGEINEEGEEEEPLSPSLKMEAALKVMFRLDLAREMRILSVDELDLYDDMKSLLPRLEAEIGEDNADGADAVEEEEAKEEEDNADGADAVEEEEPLSPALQKEAALTEEEEEHLLPALKMEVALQMVVAKVIMFHFDLAEKRMLSTEEPLSPALQKDVDEADDVDDDEEEPLLPALQMEAAIEILFRLDLARKKRILSTYELDLIIHLKSILPRLEAEIGEVNAHGADGVEEEGEPLSPSLKMQAALKIMFRLDLARKMRTLSVDELDLYDDMKSLLPRLEVEIGEDNIDWADDVEEEEEEDNADGADAVEEEEEEEEPLSPAVQKEVAIEILFRFDLARKKRTLSAGELDLIIFLKSQLARLEAEIGEVNEEEEDEEEEGESLSPALRMEAALKVMFRLDLAREMSLISADELDLYDDMKSLLPRLEAEIRELATTPSITLEDPPTCQLHAPSVALAGANEVSSPMVPGASTSIKHSADIQFPEHSIVATNAELSTPGPEATPSALKSSAEPEPAVVDDEITEALYGHSVRRRRLPIFRDICPE